jgi:SNF2 family DNA or RNA helicase
MGLGKTLQAIATLEYVRDSYPAVVVCPPNLVLNWQKEYEKWLPDRKVVTVTDRKTFPEHKDFDVLVIGYSNINHWQKQIKDFRSFVFDESHYIKSPTSQRTKAAIKIARTAPRQGIILCLTGTPVTNRPAEYASQLDVLGKLNTFGGLWGFYRRYCGAFRDRFGQWNISGNSNLDELNEKLRGNCYIRRTKDQVLKDLPPVRHANIIVAGSPTQMAEYRKAERDIVEYLVERAKQIALELGTSPGSAAVVAKIKAEANEHLVRISVLRRLAAKAKMDSVVEFIESHKEAGLKVVVAAHHRDVVDEIANKFGGLKIQGGMLVEEVEAAKSRFQEESTEDAPVIVLSIQAAKTGHTLTASQDVLFVELPWTPADVDQTYSRCHRLGQKGSVTATYLLCEGTVDEEIYNLISRKRGVVNAATDGGAVGKREDSVGQMLVGLFAERGLNKI